MTLRTWDADQKGGMDTFYGHRSMLTEISQIGDRNFVSASQDRFPIIWKLDKESQMIFSEQLFPLDSVCSLSEHLFVTGSNSGEIQIFNIAKKKPILTINDFEDKSWITAISTIYNSDFFIVGGNDGYIYLYKFESKKMTDVKAILSGKIKSEGVVNCIKISEDGTKLAIVESNEHRLGRWITDDKVKSKIRLINL